MLKRLLIIGAGGFGRQLESYIDDENTPDNNLPLAGFLDDNPDALKGKGTDRCVLGSLKDFKFLPGDAVIIAIGDSLVRETLFNELKEKVALYSYISKRATLGKNVHIGEGSIICPGANIGSNVRMGKGSLVNLNAIVGHDSILDDFCSIMPHVDIGGNAAIGNLVFIGTNATITPGNKVADRVNIGCGAVLIREALEQGTYYGNPARRML